MALKTSKQPVIFGDPMDDQERATFTHPKLRDGDYDPFYIPGYTEQRQANDIAKGHSGVLPEHVKKKYYTRFGKAPGEMRHEFKWVRIASPSGEHSYNADVDATMYAQKGYRPVEITSKEDFESKYGYGFPPAAQIVDGKIRQLDVALFVIDGEQARLNEEEQRAYNEWFHGANQPKQGEQTRIPFDIVDFDSDAHAKSTVDDLPDAFTAGPAINIDQ